MLFTHLPKQKRRVRKNEEEKRELQFSSEDKGAENMVCCRKLCPPKSFVLRSIKKNPMRLFQRTKLPKFRAGA